PLPRLTPPAPGSGAQPPKLIGQSAAPATPPKDRITARRVGGRRGTRSSMIRHADRFTAARRGGARRAVVPAGRERLREARRGALFGTGGLRDDGRPLHGGRARGLRRGRARARPRGG